MTLAKVSSCLFSTAKLDFWMGILVDMKTAQNESMHYPLSNQIL
jgi:hypothetical protein